MVLQGIEGMQMGDGAGGKIALNLEQRVLRILADQTLSYITATIKNPAEVKAGSVIYHVPELIGASDYGTGTGAFDVGQDGIRTINLDTRRNVRMENEIFDIARLYEGDYIVGMITTGIAMAIQADLNGQFLMYLKSQFDAGGALTAQTITLDYVAKQQTTKIDQDLARLDLKKIGYKLDDLSSMYDKQQLGVAKAEFVSFVSPTVNTNFTDAFWGQPNTIGTGVVDKTLAGKQIGEFKYTVEKMLDKDIPAGSSFSKDKAVNLTGYVGFIVHNEAVAMPMNLNFIKVMDNPDTGNLRFLTKYQFGIGVLRPKLIGALKRDTTKAEIKNLKATA